MKTIFRLGILMSVVILLVVGLTPTVSVQAQANNCFGLSADDVLLRNAQNCLGKHPHEFQATAGAHKNSEVVSLKIIK